MSASAPSSIDRARAETLAIQSRAADPSTSVWVAANAGTGKTHVLTERVLRMLLADTAPDRILCLTYTKAAAAEMSTRVFQRLSTWVTATPDELARLLTALLGRRATDAEKALARTLFARAIETPGGLKVQTIHAFCERLLQRFPLEAGVPPGFEVLDEEAAAELRREATDSVLTRATADRGAPLGRALITAIAYAAEDGFDEMLARALAERDWIAAAQRLGLDAHADSFAAAEAVLRDAFAVRATVTKVGLLDEIGGLLKDAELIRLSEILVQGSKQDQGVAAFLTVVRTARSPAARRDALDDLMLTDRGPRSKLVTNPTEAAFPGTRDALARAQARYVALDAELRGVELVDASIALMRLADAVLDRYTAAKQRRAGLDFADLVAHTANLLRTADAAQWVLYKLDGGLDHILVDESQDTSPEQWAIVAGLAREFFAGAGQQDKRRTLFAVGDEKQSIYSFQGAAPEQFAAMGEAFASMARNAALPFARLPLTLSFRTVAPVLAAVDRVFADPAVTPGVARTAEQVCHIAHRVGQAGLVELWPAETWDVAPDNPPWLPFEEAPAKTPADRLAERVADTIAGWLERGERLASQDRPITAGDILILVRKRRPFAPRMVSALKARGIPVAGADRIRTTEQIAVEDLIALGDFLALAEDDLALATVLKSPLVGLTDDDLMALAPERRGTLWSALLAAADRDMGWTRATEQLKRWRRRADLTPPFELFSELLDRDGGRTALLSRLGPEAADGIDELLNLALSYDEREAPSLTGFLAWLRRGTREIKRDMEHGRNEVRVMTVHGAKGLEAPIVFLPDTCSKAASSSGRGLLRLEGVPMPLGVPQPMVWPVKGSRRLTAVGAARQAQAAREAAEHQRLLYVAMTRARDRLYVTGFENRNGRGSGCWYDLISNGLQGALTPAAAADSGQVLRLAADQTSAPESTRAALADAEAAVAPPDWARRRAPAEPHLAVPIAPSRFVPYEVDTEGEPAEAMPGPSRADKPPGEPSPRALAADNRFLRGTLTHALLEHLPQFTPDRRSHVAEAFVAVRGAGLSPRQRASIVAETLAVLNGSDFAALFGPASRAEVPIAALIPSPVNGQPPLDISGQIDRLAVLESEVWIVDYKTNRPPPQLIAGVAEAYLFQLAAYRLAVQHIFPGKVIRAFILWTDGPRIMEIPAEMLDHRQSQLWELHPARLDAAMGDT